MRVIKKASIFVLPRKIAIKSDARYIKGWTPGTSIV
jgi:hypothetical protein